MVIRASLGNKAHVKIKNQFAPVIGTVGMNLTIIDITNIPDVSLDDTVTLLGPDTPISADTLSALTNSINIELTTRINPTIKRIIVE